MKKPIIGVLPLYDREKDSYWMLPAYFHGLEYAGALPVMLPLNGAEDCERLLEICDGLLFTGGQDVDPALYGEQILDCCGELCSARDQLEAALLQFAIKANKPILGICRGLQLINAALGGTLWQDLPSQRPDGLNHRMERPYDRTEHTVTLSGPLAAAYGAESLGVNSCHHQGIKTLAPTLHAMAVAEDGLIEAVYNPEKPFFWAVQWHPEFFEPENGPGTAIFRAFVNASAEEAEKRNRHG
ncbi:MAG: gamma-glutamyl-gamma-aminobutyrate hydrolase family protein [Oscillospiraceae bacterium]|nr:gamma-glutamyl-gamma-aminobutyrate hydrolase family protein [Oscillospiraceae bacterium]